MKKLFSLAVLCLTFGLMNAQVNYYVSDNGLDTNDGKSESAAFATLTAADAAIVADEALDATTPSVYIVNISGTVTAGGSCFFKTSEASDITITGESPATSTIQMEGDDSYATGTSNPGRFFNMTNSMSTNVRLTVKNLTIKNFGFKPAKSWGAGALCNQKNDYFELESCVIMNGRSRSGTINQTATDNAVFKMNNCYVSDIMSYIGEAGVFSPVRIRKGEGSVTNCVFNNITKDFEVSGHTIEADAQINNGTVISIGDDSTNTISVHATVINNTFINCKVTAGTSDMPQSAIFIDNIDTLSLNGTIANNLFVDNNRDELTDVDVLFMPLDSTLDSLIIRNNVISYSDGIDTATNDINEAYTYTSEEIAMIMEGDLAKVFTHETGMMYVKAQGTSIFEKGDAVTATTSDIIETVRSTTAPSIGALEVEEVTASTNRFEEISFKVYPNPSTGNITISALQSGSVVSIYNQLGQSVYTQLTSNTELSINALNSGLYFVKVTANGQSSTTKLIVR